MKYFYQATLIYVCTLVPYTLANANWRQTTPIVGGTQLQFPRGNCTAGVVLQRTGLFNNFTQYRKALRFVLTAGHCGENNDLVKVGGNNVGKVVWKSNVSDLMLVQVEPVLKHRTYCSAPSTGLTCSIATTYDPLAVGKIILPNPTTRVLDYMHVTGVASPSVDERFCTSGHVTGVNCSWNMVRLPGWIHQADTTVKYATTFSTINIQSGDSGGPVASRTGKIYGIIKGFGNQSGEFKNHMKYTPIAQFFSEQSEYELAPPHVIGR